MVVMLLAQPLNRIRVGVGVVMNFGVGISAFLAWLSL